MKVTIIVPNYNHSQFLKKRLDSIFNQTYQDFEVILLDDASTDDSQTILAQYARRKEVSHFITNKQNTGNPFIQWKHGIELAKGKYIWIAESDDWAAVNFLEEMVNVLDSNTNISLAYCQSYIANKEGEIVRSNHTYTSIFKRNKWEADYIEEGNTEIKYFLRKKNTIPNASAVLFKNEKNIISYINTNFRLNGDWAFWIQLIRNQKLAFTKEHLNFFREHDSTTRTRSNYSKRKKYFEENLMILKLVSKTSPDIDWNNEKKRLFYTYPFPTNWHEWKYLKTSLKKELKNTPFFMSYILKKIERTYQNFIN